MRGLIRIHLSTGLFAMFFVSVLMGLNFRPRERTDICFYGPDGGHYQAATLTDDEVLVKYDRRAWYGWPYTLISTEEYRESIFSRTEEPELRNLPIHTGGCCVDVLDAGAFKQRAPLLYRKFQNPQYSSGVYFNWNFDAVLQYICASLAILWSLMLALEWHLRSRALRDTTADLQPHA